MVLLYIGCHLEKSENDLESYWVEFFFHVKPPICLPLFLSLILYALSWYS
jgi:hypothetical protein